jgi:DNA-binding MarR family transcriptional regulator
MSQKQELVDMGTEMKILVNLLAKLIKQSLEKRLKEAKIKVGILGFSVLRILYCKDQMISELGNKLIIRSSTLVPVIDSLEKEGLVKKIQDKKDRRCHTITITAKGVALIKKVPLVSHDEMMVKLMEKIGREDSGRLLLILRKVVVAMGGSKEIENIGKVIKIMNSK